MLSMVQRWAMEQHLRDRKRTLNANLVLGPEQLALLRGAFDAAWKEVASHYNSSSVEAARLRLANAVFAAYRRGTIEPAAIKAVGVQSLLAWQPGLSPIFALAHSKDERGADQVSGS
jgi:hypothetical protein